jgi:hypothetical protein
MRTPANVLDAYGEWIARLAPWSHFVSLTHDARRLATGPTVSHQAYSRIGLQRHRRLVRDWFFDDVRKFDNTARLWSETELHKSGQPHEHALLALRPNAPSGLIMEAWFNRAGAYDRQPLETIEGTFSAARYVAKYTAKGSALEPRVWGFGLLAEASFSRVLLRL